MASHVWYLCRRCEEVVKECLEVLRCGRKSKCSGLRFCDIKGVTGDHSGNKRNE
ncbi:hypothetical protein YC2023_095607 [Brassica napus]